MASKKKQPVKKTAGRKKRVDPFDQEFQRLADLVISFEDAIDELDEEVVAGKEELSKTAFEALSTLRNLMQQQRTNAQTAMIHLAGQVGDRGATAAIAFFTQRYPKPEFEPIDEASENGEAEESDAFVSPPNALPS